MNAYFRQCSWHCLKTLRVKRKHRVLIALFHFVAKVRQFANPRLLIKAAVVEFIGTYNIVNYSFLQVCALHHVKI